MSSDAPVSAYYYEFKLAVYDNLSTGIVYGAYVVVYITSVYVILSKPGFTSSSFRMILLGITTFMFALGIVALVLWTIVTLQIARSGFFSTGGLSPSMERSVNAWSAILCLMYILCDVICAWRTVVIWNWDKRIIAILVLFILGTIASAGYALATGVVLELSPDNTNLSLGVLDLVMIGPTLATNLLTTGLIGWKAWQRRITVKKHLSEGSRFVRVDRVFALLIDSGLIYCFIWILYWISTFGLLPSPGLTFIVFISGLYPTLIIILISKQISPVEHYSIHSTETQFTCVPALEPPTDGSMPQSTLTLRRDYTNDSDTQTQSPSTVFTKPSDEERNLLE